MGETLAADQLARSDTWQQRAEQVLSRPPFILDKKVKGIPIFTDSEVEGLRVGYKTVRRLIGDFPQSNTIAEFIRGDPLYGTISTVLLNKLAKSLYGDSQRDRRQNYFTRESIVSVPSATARRALQACFTHIMGVGELRTVKDVYFNAITQVVGVNPKAIGNATTQTDVIFEESLKDSVMPEDTFYAQVEPTLRQGLLRIDCLMDQSGAQFMATSEVSQLIASVLDSGDEGGSKMSQKSILNRIHKSVSRGDIDYYRDSPSQQRIVFDRDGVRLLLILCQSFEHQKNNELRGTHLWMAAVREMENSLGEHPLARKLYIRQGKKGIPKNI